MYSSHITHIPPQIKTINIYQIYFIFKNNSVSNYALQHENNWLIVTNEREMLLKVKVGLLLQNLPGWNEEKHGPQVCVPDDIRTRNLPNACRKFANNFFATSVSVCACWPKPTVGRHENFAVSSHSFYEKLGHYFIHFSKYHIKILLGDFSAKLGIENIFKPTIGNDTLHQDNKDSYFRIVNFPTSSDLVVKEQYVAPPKHLYIHLGLSCWKN